MAVVVMAAGLGAMAQPMAAQARHVAAAAVTDNGPTAAGASVVLLDARSGQVLTSAGADIPRYPASLTKLMTLDLAFEAIREGRLSLAPNSPSPRMPPRWSR